MGVNFFVVAAVVAIVFVEANSFSSRQPCSAIAGQISLSRQLFRVGYTDKFDSSHRYEYAYTDIFQCSRLRNFSMLEIGLGCGVKFRATGPLAWRKLFPHVTLHYLEYDSECIRMHPQAKTNVNGQILFGDQSDINFLNTVVTTLDMKALHAIVDDGSHKSVHQVITMNHLFPFLMPGGIYAIEDLHCSFSLMSIYNTSWPKRAVYFISKVYQRFVLNQLPKSLEGCVEVNCEVGICWFKKGPVERLASHEMPWCSASDMNTPQLSPQMQSRYEDAYTLLQRLRCSHVENARVYHLTSSQGNSPWWGDIFHTSQLSHHVVNETTAFELPSQPALAIIDDGTFGVETRVRLLRTYFSTHVQAGGFYFLELPSDMSGDAREAMAHLMSYALYSVYCQLRMKVRVNKERFFRQINAKLCEEDRAFAGLFRVGCGFRFCYLQKVPMSTPTIHIGLMYVLTMTLPDDEIQPELDFMKKFRIK